MQLSIVQTDARKPLIFSTGAAASVASIVTSSMVSVVETSQQQQLSVTLVSAANDGTAVVVSKEKNAPSSAL